MPQDMLTCVCALPIQAVRTVQSFCLASMTRTSFCSFPYEIAWAKEWQGNAFVLSEGTWHDSVCVVGVRGVSWFVSDVLLSAVCWCFLTEKVWQRCLETTTSYIMTTMRQNFCTSAGFECFGALVDGLERLCTRSYYGACGPFCPRLFVWVVRSVTFKLTWD